MRLRSLRIERFRLLTDVRLELDGGIHLFVGANAQGKTSILEAIGFLATGRSIRTGAERECLAHGAPPERPFAAIEGLLDGRSGARTIRCVLESRRKAVWLDGKPLRGLSELWGVMKAVFFVPADLEIVQGSPGVRRTVLDSILGQTEPSYLRTLRAYHQALSNRNALLRAGANLRDAQFDAFESALAQHGARLIRHRREVCEALSRSAGDAIARLTDGTEQLRLEYLAGVPGTLDVGHALSKGPDALAADLAALWRQQRRGDHDRRVTRDGPQRDDVRFLLAGNDARAFASQGQCRTCVLALRLAQLELLARQAGEPPLLLLDDIFGELDRRRFSLFLRAVEQAGFQTLVTATDAAPIEEAVHVGARWTVERGSVRPPRQ